MLKRFNRRLLTAAATMRLGRKISPRGIKQRLTHTAALSHAHAAHARACPRMPAHAFTSELILRLPRGVGSQALLCLRGASRFPLERSFTKRFCGSFKNGGCKIVPAGAMSIAEAAGAMPMAEAAVIRRV
eukprot:2834551-Pleurochrysis_carterae.AAC.2